MVPGNLISIQGNAIDDKEVIFAIWDITAIERDLECGISERL